MYKHKVCYYETDKMGITHHSNYIRWMEEARVDYLEKIGFGYDKLEEQGIISPVIGIECEYKESTRFNDEILIETKVAWFKGVRLAIEYKMTNAKTSAVVLVGTSKHCFIGKNNMPVALKKVLPEFDAKLKELASENEKKEEFRCFQY